MKKISLLLTYIFIWCALVVGCSNSDYTPSFDTTTRTEVGAKLVSGTDLFGAVYGDTTYTVVKGVTASEINYLSMKGLAMKMFIFEIDLKQDGLTMRSCLPNDGDKFAMQPMTQQAMAADRAGNTVWAGVNADFYNMSTGVPRGPFHKNGVMLKNAFDSGVRGFFAITNENKGLIGTSAEYPEVAASNVIREAVGASVMLVRDGTVITQTDESIEPRTCIGISKDATKIYIMIVDGRRFHYSNGMQFQELGQCMAALGAWEAINLDGGGSSTFFVRAKPGYTAEDRFQIRNWPTDNGGQERSVANGLLIISNK